MSLPITVLLALVFSAGLLGCDTAPESEATGNASVGTTPVLTEAPRTGHLAPDFVLTTLDGREVRLSDYRGHVVFLNFWATWCGPCKVEMPAIERLYREYRRQACTTLAGSTDLAGSAAARPYRGTMRCTF